MAAASGWPRGETGTRRQAQQAFPSGLRDPRRSGSSGEVESRTYFARSSGKRLERNQRTEARLAPSTGHRRAQACIRWYRPVRARSWADSATPGEIPAVSAGEPRSSARWSGGCPERTEAPRMLPGLLSPSPARRGPPSRFVSAVPASAATSGTVAREDGVERSEVIATTSTGRENKERGSGDLRATDSHSDSKLLLLPLSVRSASGAGTSARRATVPTWCDPRSGPASLAAVCGGQQRQRQQRATPALGR